MYGACEYLPLCTHYTDVSLRNYQPAEPSEIKEDLVVKHLDGAYDGIIIEGVRHEN